MIEEDHVEIDHFKFIDHTVFTIFRTVPVIINDPSHVLEVHHIEIDQRCLAFIRFRFRLDDSLYRDLQTCYSDWIMALPYRAIVLRNYFTTFSLTPLYPLIATRSLQSWLSWPNWAGLRLIGLTMWNNRMGLGSREAVSRFLENRARSNMIDWAFQRPRWAASVSATTSASWATRRPTASSPCWTCSVGVTAAPTRSTSERSASSHV